MTITVTRPLTAAWHTWEPGLYTKENTSAGGAVWIKFLWRYLAKQTIRVVDLYPLQKQTPPPVDVAIFCWRWDFPDNERYGERHRAYVRQMQLIEWYTEHKTPIIIHDEDYMMAPADLKRLQEIGATLTEPSLKPREGFKSLHFPYPFGRTPVNARRKEPGLVYIGNNYGRYDQFKRYFGQRFKTFKPVVYGNWLEAGIDRESPEQVRADFPNVMFPGRLPQADVIATMSEFPATVQLAKPEYCEHGFLTIRWAEAVAANCVGLVPTDFFVNDDLKELVVDPSHVESLAGHIARDYETSSCFLRLQSEFVKDIMHPYSWVARIREVAQ